MIAGIELVKFFTYDLILMVQKNDANPGGGHWAAIATGCWCDVLALNIIEGLQAKVV